MRVNFAAGIVVGLLFAAFLVFASSGLSGPSTFAPVRATGGLVQYTATQTVTSTATSTSSSTLAAGVVNVAPFSNKTSSSGAGSSTSTSSILVPQATSTYSVSGTTRPPSSLAAISGEPFQSWFLLLPVALAALLGLVLYRTSGSRD